MPKPAENNDRQNLIDRPEARRLLRFAHSLPSADRERLEMQIADVDFDLMSRLFEQSKQASAPIDRSAIKPFEVLELPRTSAERDAWQAAERVGEEALAAGRCAVLLVAGGQGSRLGFEGPKGMFPIGAVSHASLFQIFAEKIRKRARNAGCSIPWYIMTSPGNRQATQDFFEANQYFGQPKSDVTFFVQGTMPAASISTGELLLADAGNLFLSPNGHGGTLLALAKEGVLEDMRRRGVDLVYYFQVDNPLVCVLEPAFIGQHLMAKAEFSAKVVRKSDPKEKVGLVVRYNGAPTVIEYSDLPDDLATQPADSGEGFAYWPGSIAIHIFDRTFLERVANELPYHIAIKTASVLDDEGKPSTPNKPNAIKFEMFIFDCLPMAKRVNIVETNRDDEFAPVKNGRGSDSPATCQAAMTNQAGRWLNAAGIEYPKDASGEPAFALEISPLAGVDLADFLRAKRARTILGPTYFQEDF